MTARRSRSYQRYLASKATVDDRALHRPTFDRLAEELSGFEPAPLRVLEVGAGVGTMLQRLLRWGLFEGTVRYTAIDIRPENVETGRKRLREWATERGYDVAPGRPMVLRGEGVTAVVEYRVADAFSFAASDDREWHLLVGCAFLDLVELRSALDSLFDRVAPGGLCYFPITFDGETAFEPTPNPDFEERLLDAYHETMDDPTRPGGSRTGRRLFGAVDALGGDVLAAGGSDWVVTPPYPHDEAYFLHYVVDGIERALREGGAVDDERLTEWTASRHEAIEAEDLVYLAHQLDVLCRVSDSTSRPEA